MGQEEVFNECISIMSMHGKLVLSSEYFNETISHSVVNLLFLKSNKSLAFLRYTRSGSYAESLRTVPIFSFTLCTIKHF